MLRKLLYFGSNEKSIPRPTKKLFSGYKPWVYIQDFTVYHWPFEFLQDMDY